jgi:hypothetical protein
VIRADKPLGFSVHFGKPVPGEWIRDKSYYAAACKHLLHEFLPLLRTQPEQSGFQLLWSIQTLVPEPEPIGATGPGVIS